jgi:Holliday junction resolvase
LPRNKDLNPSSSRIEKVQSFTMLIGLQEWIMMKTSNKKQTMIKPMTTMRKRTKKKMKISMNNMIKLTKKNSKS